MQIGDTKTAPVLPIIYMAVNLMWVITSGDGYTVYIYYIIIMHTLTKFIGITPLFPSLFSARYQYITLQGSIIVSCSPQRNDKS